VGAVAGLCLTVLNAVLCCAAHINAGKMKTFLLVIKLENEILFCFDKNANCAMHLSTNCMPAGG